MTEHDRGALSQLQFIRCENGFILTGSTEQGLLGQVWAFNDIHGLAQWLVDQYTDEPDDARSSYKRWQPSGERE